MNPVIPCSIGNVSIIPGFTYSTKKSNTITRLNLSRSTAKPGSSSWRFLLPSFVASGTFPQNKSIRSFHKKSRTSISATETDVAVEEAGPPVADEDSGEISSNEIGISEDSSSKSDANPDAAKAKRSRPARKSEMPPVKNEDLIPGASFTGKVKSIQPFGAFVDFGAFTDGLVHISMLSDSFVKDVASVVSIGQEVKVKLIEVNNETRRISLSMRENADTGKQRKDAPIKTEKAGSGKRSNSKPSSRKDNVTKSTKLVIGQLLVGSVKNLARSGAFISLPEGEEGFLPVSEEPDDGFDNVMGNTRLEVGQEINVRVLRINRGQVTLTMKTEEDATDSTTTFNQGVVHTATNPFVLAFRKNKDISSFLDEREKPQSEVQKPSPGTTLEEIKETVKQGETVPDVPGVQGEPVSSKLTDDVPPAVKQNAEGDISAIEENVGISSTVGSSTAIIDTPLEKEEDAVSGSLTPEEDIPTVNPTIEEAIQTEVTTSDLKTDSPVETATENVIESGVDVIVTEDEKQSQTLNAVEEFAAAVLTDTDVKESGVDEIVTEDEKQSQTLNAVEEFAAAVLTDTDAVGASPDGNGTITESDTASTAPALQETAAADDVGAVPEVNDADTSLSDETEEKDQVPSPESSATEVVKTSNDNPEEELQKQTTVTENENSFTSQVEEKEIAVASEENISLSSSDGQTVATSGEGSSKATISPALVKQLREETGAGMMDCKKALSETDGDIIKAQEYLRKKGLSSAEKKASRVTAEGRIGSYIHDNRIGVLVEVNCETDFVSRGEIFKDLVDDIAMQVAACPQIEYLVTEDVPEEIVKKEKEIEMQKEDLLSKPEQIRSKIVEGRINKRLEELALLEQPYIKNDKVAVKDLVKQTIATIGENIKVKRFVRFNLGEGLEKKSQDFAAEVAAQTAAKPAPAPAAPANEQPAVAEAKETEPKKSTVAISASLVKQLREETGAGMMDCKKALAETEGDLEKAQEYLRKKGLSSADKKSSRLAAEGRIGSYIHDSRIGVLIEVNCETDFVGRGEKFKELVEDLAMQVVASPQVQFVSIEEIPETVVNKEKELERQREDLLSKPENIREKIVEGRVSKRLGELALLEQPFIKDDSVLVKDLVKQTVAALGENIKVRRFVRFTLGETTEKETAVEA
ncbi:A-kinase anchor protein 200 isoform X3 [Vigna unguiculata]|uniref:A-kinase anchor protein 200 isoform X3 n=1 Tax=Vigna unguiculata TaxID=3917 RepID=UPI00101681F0|nr:A-kinase anchor protein 200 isoform X3 [Vigna unguiculata]